MVGGFVAVIDEMWQSGGCADWQRLRAGDVMEGRMGIERVKAAILSRDGKTGEGWDVTSGCAQMMAITFVHARLTKAIKAVVGYF